MEETTLEKLKYPIGTFKVPQPITSQHLTEWIDILENFPQQLTKLVSKFTDKQLDTPYRPDGWTVRQVIHHLADSHLNSYIRFKWALTEQKPTIKAYYEERWAELNDGKNAPILLSLYLITSLHARWVFMLKELSPNELQLTFLHPENGKEITLAENIGVYAWHCIHHFAHINNLRKRMNW